MKISYLSATYIPSRKAMTVHVMKMCQAFARHGHDVTLFGRRGPENADDDYEFYGVKPCFRIVKCLSPAGIGFFGRGLVFTADLTYRVLSEPRPDFFYGRSINCFPLLTHLGIPMGFEAHYVPVGSVEQRLLRWTFRQRNFILLVTISEALRQEYLRLYPCLSPRKVVACHDGADIPRADLPPLDESTWPGRAGAMRVGFVGNLYGGHGVDMIPKIAADLPDVDFHIIGGFERDIDSWRRRNPQPPNVHLHGFVPPNVCDAYRRAMDVLIAPYQEEFVHPDTRNVVETSRWMSPLKVFEYMAAGKPIVCSDIPVLREILTDGENAVLVAPTDLRAWVRAIGDLRADARRGRRLGRRAFDDLASTYTWSKRAESIADAALARMGAACRHV